MLIPLVALVEAVQRPTRLALLWLHIRSKQEDVELGICVFGDISVKQWFESDQGGVAFHRACCAPLYGTARAFGDLNCDLCL